MVSDIAESWKYRCTLKRNLLTVVHFSHAILHSRWYHFIPHLRGHLHSVLPGLFLGMQWYHFVVLFASGY